MPRCSYPPLRGSDFDDSLVGCGQGLPDRLWQPEALLARQGFGRRLAPRRAGAAYAAAAEAKDVGQASPETRAPLPPADAFPMQEPTLSDRGEVHCAIGEILPPGLP